MITNFLVYVQPSGVYLRVDVWDDDYGNDDKIDKCRIRIHNLQPGTKYSRNCNGDRSHSPTKLELEYKLTCDGGFNGPDCACEDPAHGRCKDDGTLECEDGWASESMNSRCGCEIPEHGTCQDDNSLVCDPGWGTDQDPARCSCEIPEHGICLDDGTIQCDVENGGMWGTKSTRCDRFCEPPTNGFCDFSLPDPYIRCSETWRGPPECEQCESHLFCYHCCVYTCLKLN